jgi:hypothetical protein
VIVTLESTNGALAAKAATQAIPIVFMQGADPSHPNRFHARRRPGDVPPRLAETINKPDPDRPK